MKFLATLVLLLAVAAPASAVVVHNEAVNGDLSTDPSAPTALAFGAGGNTVIGTVFNSGFPNPTGDRDFIRFSIPEGRKLIALNLLVWSPDNIGFCAFNAGNTSYVPSAATDPNFLAGVHLFGSWAGTDILPRFVTDYATSNSLLAPELGPGTYCFVIQQTTNVVSSYSLEFVLDGSVSSQRDTWSAIKRLYR